MPTDRRSVGEKRLDAFVDAAFAFAVSILIIGIGDKVESFDDLLAAFSFVPAFLVSLIIILGFWWAHRQYTEIVSRRDKVSGAFSILIMFIIMVFVYPVSFLAQALLHWLTDAWLPGQGLHPGQIRTIYQIFGAGFALLSGIYALLYFRATRGRIRMRLRSHFRPIALRASAWWAACGVTSILSIITARSSGLEGLIWLPLVPYLIFLLLLLANYFFGPFLLKQHPVSAQPEDEEE